MKIEGNGSLSRQEGRQIVLRNM